MGKTICKEKKKILKKEKGPAEFLCKKCGEKAAREKYLCKPRKI